jgi:formylglycine-generating enzyme required for sulfatase activity
MQTVTRFLLVGIIVGLVGWINQDYVREQFNWFTTMRPYMLVNYRPYVLAAQAERNLKPQDRFRECARDCPWMIVIPPGEFIMGSPDDEPGRRSNEGPRQKITISKAFAVAEFDVTFAEWDACVAVGGCPRAVDSGFGRGNRPVINVNWDDAKKYAEWLSLMTGQQYRLLTEKEFEYVARAGTATAFSWGNEIGKGNANCIGCGSKWDNSETAPVGSFNPNSFGVFDMHGNVWKWVENCYRDSLHGIAPVASARTARSCSHRVVRGGGWSSAPSNLRSAYRDGWPADVRYHGLGIRIARTLMP